MGNKQMFQCINVIFIMIVTNGSCILVHKYENMSFIFILKWKFLKYLHLITMMKIWIV
jgi:hypothetical protein